MIPEALIWEVCLLSAGNSLICVQIRILPQAFSCLICISGPSYLLYIFPYFSFIKLVSDFYSKKIYSKYICFFNCKSPWEICKARFLLYQKQRFIAVVEKQVDCLLPRDTILWAWSHSEGITWTFQGLHLLGSNVGICSKWSLTTVNFQMFKLVLEKAEEWEIKLPTSTGSSKMQESSRKISVSALLTMPKPLTVWITRNCGKFWKRWEYQTTWHASWETYMQVWKQQLKLDMEQQTGFK